MLPTTHGMRQIGDLTEQIVAGLRFQRDVEHLCRLGPAEEWP